MSEDAGAEDQPSGVSDAAPDPAGAPGDLSDDGSTEQATGRPTERGGPRPPTPTPTTTDGAGAAPSVVGRPDERDLSPHRGTFAALRYRNFAMFWTGAVLSNTGSSMQMVTVPYVIFTLTNSTAWLGISSAIAFIPNVLVGPIGGALADRYNRRSVLLITQTIQMLAAFALWIVWIAGAATVGSILALVLVSSVAGGINISSWQAFVPSLVPRRDLMNAVRLNSIQFTVARAGGPVLAGLLLATVGAGATFLGNAISFVPVIAALMLIPSIAVARRTTDHSIAREFADGVGYIRRHPSLFECIVNVLILSSLSFAIVQLAPAIAKNQLHIGKAGYGFLVATYGLGSIVCGFLVAARGDNFKRSSAVVTAVVLAIIGALLLGLSTNFPLGAVAFFTTGFAQTLAAVSHQTTIQVQVNERFRGRVLAVYLMAVQLGLPLGALVLGTIAATTGTRSLAVGAGVLLGGYLVFVAHRVQGVPSARSERDVRSRGTRRGERGRGRLRQEPGQHADHSIPAPGRPSAAWVRVGPAPPGGEGRDLRRRGGRAARTRAGRRPASPMTRVVDDPCGRSAGGWPGRASPSGPLGARREPASAVPIVVTLTWPSPVAPEDRGIEPRGRPDTPSDGRRRFRSSAGRPRSNRWPGRSRPPAAYRPRGDRRHSPRADRARGPLAAPRQPGQHRRKIARSEGLG